MLKRIHRTPAAAEYIGHKTATLEKWRVQGKGPRFVKIGSRSVGYTEEDLDAFIEAGRRASTSDSGPNRRSSPRKSTLGHADGTP
jgi:predicted DNA-binding transcriptional regulator AlpA